MLILILMDVQFLENVISSFQKGWNGQNHSSSDFDQPVKKFPHPLRLFGKSWAYNSALVKRNKSLKNTEYTSPVTLSPIAISLMKTMFRCTYINCSKRLRFLAAISTKWPKNLLSLAIQEP